VNRNPTHEQQEPPAVALHYAVEKDGLGATWVTRSCDMNHTKQNGLITALPLPSRKDGRCYHVGR